LALPTIAQITLFFISFLFPKNILGLNYWLWKAEPSEVLGTTTEWKFQRLCFLLAQFLEVVPALSHR
jgi:hypothetical protein